MQPWKLFLSLFLQTVLWLCIMGAILFGTAGSMRWQQGWSFLAIFALGSVVFGAWLGRRDPGLLAQRLGPVVQRGQPLWDRLFLLVFVVVWLGWLAVMGLDAQRWHTSHMPVWLNGLGGVLVVFGFLGVLRVLAENSFAAPVPYAMARHPMYTAAIVYLAGMPILLGSWYGLMAVPLMVLAIARRAVLEERMLARDLAGYENYRTRLRWRLIPHLW
jgi:protein-S-isoprenylcysteine O-methyltransferase Ste14